MKPALADRLCHALVSWYPRRWKQCYATEMLEVLDQYHAGPRTVLSLAGGALTTHLDPGYRMELRPMPRLSKDAKLAVVLSAVVAAGLIAIVALPAIAQNIRESSWHQSNSGAVASVVFSRDRRILVGAADGPPWSGTSILWDVTDQAQPRRLAEFEGGTPHYDLAGRPHRGHDRARPPADPVERDQPAPPGPAGRAVGRLRRRPVG